ncbi:MAG: winged helix-turn-helix transcriptional regulator [Pseudomonadota bacterium]|uniref:Winged helix-turn-helix transcriptional regulator n=1 Tax=Candidatus Desulfatibia profunda TaxID=2841695 RepID=A0A8J6NMX3_9BACT|nr:winged helix-turn-helix transcriptional regulator [Candidatus Desulfatibia profunda]MBL7180959.1 winged helix-turn-helix transcriptional regulator [Desulfobacterales bacterium]
MNRQDIRTLKILEEIDKGNDPSQRELAKKLDISLGLANSFIKRLVQKGYFKVTNIPKKRVKYILTPKGAAEKTRLTYKYIQYSYKFYSETRQKLSKLFKELESQGILRMVFYGANDFAEIAYISLQETRIQIVAVVDDEKIGEKFFGNRVTSTATLDSLSFDKILISSLTLTDSVLKKILEKGISRSKVVILG